MLSKQSSQLLFTKGQKRNYVPLEIIIPSVVVPMVSFGAFFNYRYLISKPDQYLIRTGLFIKDIAVDKQALLLPFQMASFVQMEPTNYTFDLHAMSSEKMEFVLPGVFTIGPKDDPEEIKKYVKLLRNSGNIDSLILGVLEGETRSLAGQMTIEQIFNGRKEFKEILIKHIQDELNQFGLIIYNANIKELQDAPGSEYFEFIRQKKRSEAENKAKIDVADATKQGDIGQKERSVETRQQVAILEAETVLKENTRLQDIENSKAELEVVKASALQKTQLARIEADKTSKIRDAELQMKVEQQRINMETEKLRANDFSKAQVQAEIDMKNAEGKARALEIEAQGKAKALEIEATAKLFAKQKEAAGLLEIFNAQSEGCKNLIMSFNNNPDALIKYLMLEKDQYRVLAEANAKAIQGLNPKITTYNLNGTNADPITDIFKMIPPLVDTLKDQMGVKKSETE